MPSQESNLDLIMDVERNVSFTPKETKSHTSYKTAKTKKCEHCYEMFSNLEDYWIHIRLHINLEDIIACPECPFVTEYRRHYTNHMKIHTGGLCKCDLCPYQCPTKYRMAEHVKSHTNKGMKNKRCVHCLETFSNMDDYWQHVRCHISQDKIMSCPECPFVTGYRRHYTNHMKTHTGELFKCDLCSYQCATKYRMADHMKSHSTVRQFRCEDCRFSAKYLRHLQAHSRKTGHSFNDILKPDGTVNKKEAVVHKTKIDSPQRTDDDEVLMKYLIPVITLTVDEDNQVVFNDTEASDNIKCDICSVQYNTEHDRHMSYHKQDDPFVCNECGNDCVNGIGFYCHFALNHRAVNYL